MKYRVDRWSVALLAVSVTLLAVTLSDLEPGVSLMASVAALFVIVPGGVHGVVGWRRNRRAFREAIAALEAFEAGKRARADELGRPQEDAPAEQSSPRSDVTG